MLQRILGGVLVLLGLVAVALGVASATVWRDSDTVVATAEPVGDGTLVVTDPGVLGLVSGDVTVSAKGAEGQPVSLVVGRDVDVLGWIGDDPYSRVTGLQDWDTLGVEAGAAESAEEGEDAEAEEAAPSGADPAGNDMWVAETSEDGSATLRWSDRPGRWTLMAAGVGEDAQAPTLELTWPRAVSTPYLWPAVGGGAVLVVLGGLILVLGARRARARRDDAPRGAGYAAEPAEAASEGLDAEPGDDVASSVPGSNPFAPVGVAGAPASDPETGTAPDAEPGPVADAASDQLSGETSGEPDSPSASGTAEVPMAARLLRRSRRRAAAQEASPATAEPVVAEPVEAPAGEAGPVDVPVDVPSGAPADPPAPSAPEPRPATGATPHLSRRELRAQEEARRAAEQGGMTRMLRAITGSIPAVRQPTPEAPAAPEPDHDLSTRAGRAAAWRATWGFGQTTGDGSAGPADDHRPTDGENR